MFEKLQDHKGILYYCLLVQRRWYDLALPHLWYHFEFSLTSERQLAKLNRLIPDEHLYSQLGFQSNFTRNPNFSFVRSLFLSVNLRGERVSNRRRCEAINDALKKYLVLFAECTGVRFLRLDLQPFVPTNAHVSIWEDLDQNNGLIYELVQIAAHREYATLFLDAAQIRWQPQDVSTGQVQYYVEALGSKITRLHLCETASLTWSWLSPLHRLRRIEFDNTGNPGIEALSSFWDAITPIALEELALSGFIFPRSRTFPNWRSLRMIRLNQFGDVEGAVSTILRSFPSLQHAAFHNPHPISNNYDPLPVSDIVCTGLRKIVFTRCRAQQNLLAQVAKACPLLQWCMPPDNASDEDIITLIDRCPNLTSLLIDCCTDLTSTSIHYIPRAERLRSLLFNFQHLFVLDEDCIFALAQNCPDLHSRGFRITAVDQTNEKIQRVMVKERFKEWFNGFVAEISEGPFHWIQVDVDSIRRFAHSQASL